MLQWSVDVWLIKIAKIYILGKISNHQGLGLYMKNNF